MKTNFTQSTLLFAFLVAMASCKKDVPLITDDDNKQTAIPCEEICYDTLSVEKKIAYYPWKFIERKSIGKEIYGAGLPKFYTDIPAGKFYHTFSNNGHISFKEVQELTNDEDKMRAHFSATKPPLFTIDFPLGMAQEVDYLGIKSLPFTVHNDFELIHKKPYSDPYTNFEQTQVTFSENLDTAYLYHYWAYDKHREQDPYYRYIRASKYYREDVPACRCKKNLLNYP